jgi:cysteinyl-tRNA synthetase
LNSIRNLREEIKKAESEQRLDGIDLDLSVHKKHFLEAMDDDFNAPLAVGVLFDLARETNQMLNSEQKMSVDSLKQIDRIFSELGGKVLGIIPDQLLSATSHDQSESSLMDLIITVRAEVRKQKLWTLSDIIRDSLKRIGYTIEDRKDNTTWRKMN